MTATQMDSRTATWGVGSLISTSFSILFRHLMAFIGIILVGSLPSLAFTLLVRLSPNQMSINSSVFWETQAISLVCMLVTLFAWIMMFHVAAQALYGRPVSIVESASRGLGRMVVAVGVAILAYLGVLLASLLLIVPGIMLSLRWIVAIPVATVEGSGVMTSLKRSAELTRGRRWRIFGAGLLFSLIAVLPMLAVFLFGAASGSMINFMTHEMQSPKFQFVFWLISAFYSAFGACFFATLYYFLRREKDGVDATVFD